MNFIDVEMIMMFRKKADKKTYDRENKKPVLHCSICTGERIAGFKIYIQEKFEEVMLIHTDQDLDDFMEQYDISTITKEY